MVAGDHRKNLLLDGLPGARVREDVMLHADFPVCPDSRRFGTRPILQPGLFNLSSTPLYGSPLSWPTGFRSKSRQALT